MVHEAESNREQDEAVRQTIDARNELDAVAYQVERRLNELGDAVPVHEKARAEMLIADARQAIQDEAPMDRLRELTGELQQIYQALMAQTGQQAGGETADATAGAAGGAAGGAGDDVIDADFTRT
jgi:molecular chaperone DnaK